MIGLGYGCTDNDCSGLADARSAVWVSPLDDADFYIDYTNSGKPQEVETVNVRESKKLTDPFDNDMVRMHSYDLLFVLNFLVSSLEL